MQGDGLASDHRNGSSVEENILTDADVNIAVDIIKSKCESIRISPGTSSSDYFRISLEPDTESDTNS